MSENSGNYNIDLIREYSGQIKELYDNIQLFRQTHAKVTSMLNNVKTDIDAVLELLDEVENGKL